MKNQGVKTGIGIVFFLVALTFVYRSFYSMRIPVDSPSAEGVAVKPPVPRIDDDELVPK
jgi:hypothetical protein